jgi:hypothetical protein
MNYEPSVLLFYCAAINCKTAAHQLIKGLTIIATLIIKSLLTSLCQREELPLFGKEGPGEIL